MDGHRVAPARFKSVRQYEAEAHGEDRRLGFRHGHIRTCSNFFFAPPWNLVYIIIDLQELLSGYVPYHDKPSDASVILAIASKQLPARPAYNKYSRFAARLWRLCERCWALNPCMRPTSAEVLHVLKEKAKQTPSSVQDQAQPVALLPGPSTGPDGQGGRELVALRDSSAPSTTSRPSRRSEDAKPNRLQKKSYATSSRATITSEDVKPRRLVKSPPEFRQDSPPGSRRTFGSRRWTW